MVFFKKKLVCVLHTKRCFNKEINTDIMMGFVDLFAFAHVLCSGCWIFCGYQENPRIGRRKEGTGGSIYDCFICWKEGKCYIIKYTKQF